MYSYVEKYQKAVEYLKKAVTLINTFYGVKLKDGKMINERLVHECNENYLANLQLLQ